MHNSSLTSFIRPICFYLLNKQKKICDKWPGDWGLHHGHPRPPRSLSRLPQLRLEEEEEEGRGVEGRGGTELSELSRFGVRLVSLDNKRKMFCFIYLLGWCSLITQEITLTQADTLQLICVALGGRLSCQCHVIVSKHIYKFKKLHNSSLTSFTTLNLLTKTEHAKKISDKWPGDWGLNLLNLLRGASHNHKPLYCCIRSWICRNISNQQFPRWRMPGWQSGHRRCSCCSWRVVSSSI